jgi:hypothetical protein
MHHGELIPNTEDRTGNEEDTRTQRGKFIDSYYHHLKFRKFSLADVFTG